MYILYTEFLGIHSSTDITTLACETLLAQVLNILQASSVWCNLSTAVTAGSPLCSLCWLCLKEEQLFNYSTSACTYNSLTHTILPIMLTLASSICHMLWLQFKKGLEVQGLRLQRNGKSCQSYLYLKLFWMVGQFCLMCYWVNDDSKQCSSIHNDPLIFQPDMKHQHSAAVVNCCVTVS